MVRWLPLHSKENNKTKKQAGVEKGLSGAVRQIKGKPQSKRTRAEFLYSSRRLMAGKKGVVLGRSLAL